jgi:alpha-beta hydrolase superfamily lysophospholipase
VVRLVAALAGLALALPATASAFGKTDQPVRMSDGVRLTTTYYVPDGAPPAGGWPAVMLLHGLGGSRNAGTPFGMSLNSLAETQLAPQGYAALTFDARGHGQSEGLVSIDGPREIQDVRELFNWLAGQAGINGQRIGSFGYSYGGGAIWRATAEGVPFAAIEPAITWTDLYSALLPQNVARSGVVLGFWQSIAARAAPELEPIVNDALAGRNLAGVRAFADQRSTRPLLGNVKAPTLLMQGRRDFAFDVDHALAAYTRLKAPKRLYLGDFGHPPSSNPAAEAQHVLPAARQWFDRYLKGLPNGIDQQPPVEVAPDPWTGRTFSYRSFPARKTLQLAFSGRKEVGSTGKVVRTLLRRKARLETFGPPALRVTLSSPNGWPHVVAVLSAVTPQRREIVVSSGGARVRLGSSPKQVAIRLISQLTNIPPRSRLRLTVAATSTAQSPGNLLYLSGVPRSARLVVGPARLTLPVLTKPISR